MFAQKLPWKEISPYCLIFIVAPGLMIILISALLWDAFHSILDYHKCTLHASQLFAY